MKRRKRKLHPVPGSIDAIVAEMTAMGMQYGKYMQYLYAEKCCAEREKERVKSCEKDV